MESKNLMTLTTENFDETINQDKLTLVDFLAEWCGPCLQQGPIIAELAESVGKTHNIAKLDVDSNQEVAAKYQVTSIPSLLVFKSGKEVKRFVGLQPKSLLEEELAEIA